MDHVLARIKRLTKQPFFKLVSDYALFDAVTVKLDECVLYQPDHNLDEDAWFKIEEFSKQNFCIEILKSDFDSKKYDDLTKDRFGDISFLASVQNGDFYFQNITPSLFIKRKYIALGEVAEIEESKVRLVINSSPDAIYYKNDDVLIFKNLSSIASIFKGIDILYREATQQEVESFLNESFIILSDDYDADKVSKPNRKRIGLAVDTLSKMKVADRKKMLSYIDSYCSGKLAYDSKEKKVTVTNDNDLKILLYGIEQRFYTTDLSKEKRLANSVQKWTV